jgi:hypothetical protein
MDSVFPSEAPGDIILVLVDSLEQIVGHSDVKGSISLARKYIHKVLSHSFWIPAFAGMTGGGRSLPLFPNNQ